MGGLDGAHRTVAAGRGSAAVPAAASEPSRSRAAWATAVGLAQFAMLLINAISRQVVQNHEVSRYFDVAGQPVQTQWSSLVVFLVSLIAGIAGIAWMLAQLPKAHASDTAH